MKSLTSAVIAELATQYGTEPVTILEIQWVDDGQWSVYADKEINDPNLVVISNIIDIGSLESVVKLDGSGRSTGISVKLDDIDGELKNTINYNDIHGRPVRVYQWFDNMPLTERFQLYEGEVTSEIVWSEGDRTLAFDVITKLADKEVGFSPEEGYFPYIPEDLMGKPWPLCFGTVQNVPGVPLQEIPFTQTAEDLGVVDPTLEPRLTELAQQYKDYGDILLGYYLALGQAEFTASYGDSEEQRTAAASTASSITSAINQIISTRAGISAEIVTLRETLAEQGETANLTLAVIDAVAFPQGVLVALRARDVEIWGTFNGNEVTISNAVMSHYTFGQEEPAGYGFEAAGTVIEIVTDVPIRYVANIVESEVHHIQAYRNLENGEALVTVPSNYYTTKTEVSGPYTFTYVEFDRPLSSIDNTFKDDIYITQTSVEGPNTVDVLQWLIETYTDLTVDPVTFAAVQAKIEKYPSHFALLDRRNIYELLEEIAWQARCAVWIQNNVVYMKYLAEETAAVDTINEADIDVGKLVMKATTTEEVVTKFVALWRNDYAVDEENKIILRHNVKKYGTREREFDFYIYNIQELVQKSATFWLIRYANVWKNITFDCHIHKLALDAYDVVNFNFAQEYVAIVDVKGMLTSITYDSSGRALIMGAWLPVRFGEMTPYDFGWPAAIDVTYKYPTPEEIEGGLAGGDGPGASVDGAWGIRAIDKASMGYTDKSDYTDARARYQYADWGDEVPSDVDDVKPTPNFIGTEFEAGEEPEYDYDYGNHDLDIHIDEGEVELRLVAVWPGKIASGSADTYVVNVYKEGLSNEPIAIQGVKQVVIDSTAELPVGTGVLVALNRFNLTRDEDGVITSYEEEYVIQAPVWL